MIRRVLIVLADQCAESTRALRLGLDLASRHGAAVTALLVCGPPPQESGCVLRLPSAAELDERRRLFTEACAPVLQGAPALAAPPTILAASGFLLVEALRAARSHEADLLVVQAGQQEPSCERELSGIMGSLALALCGDAPCPVLLLPPLAEPRQGPFERVLACVDIEGDEPAQARSLLAHAARLAAREGSELLALHALTLPQGQPTPGQEEMTRRVTAARERLAYLCHGLSGAARCVFLVSEGAPGVEILKHARERGADLLVLSQREPGPGSTLARVLAGARCPLLIFGPRTPVCAE